MEFKQAKEDCSDCESGAYSASHYSKNGGFMNYFKTFLLMAILTLIFMVIGNYAGGSGGMILAFVISVLMNFFSFWYSDKIILAMYGAKEIEKNEEPRFYEMVNEITFRIGIPMPKLYRIDTEMANAFATGRNPDHASVAVTSGILKILNEQQLKAVLAHEITHIKNRDILLSTLAAVFAGGITVLARIGFFTGGGREDRNGLESLLLVILAPIAALLIQLAISRSREYAADTGSARITGKPKDLISALEALENRIQSTPGTPLYPATAHLFIVNPFKRDFLSSLFSTHPTLAQRKINLLKNKL